MTYGEIRRESWTALWSGKWFGRLTGVWMLLVAVILLVGFVLQGAFAAHGMVGLEKYAREWQVAMKAGLGRPPVEIHDALRMLGVWLFTCFINLIFSGVFSFGWACACLKCARGDGARLKTEALGGLKRPFGMLWLTLFSKLRIYLWSLLFVIPGVIAWFRYRVAWFVKTDHPDWSAWRCLRESGRLMKGNKWRSFCLDCSYWKSALLLLLPLLLLSIIWSVAAFLKMSDASLPSVANTVLAFAGLAAFCASTVGGLVFGVHFSVGHAIFYRALLKAQEGADEAA